MQREGCWLRPIVCARLSALTSRAFVQDRLFGQASALAVALSEQMRLVAMLSDWVIAPVMPRPRKPASPFRYFNSSPEIIRLVVMMYIRFPLSLRNVEDLLSERGIDICHETVRLWWNRFGPMFAREIRLRRVSQFRGYRHWRWHVDEVFVKVNGETHYLWRAVDHEGEILESYVTRKRDKAAALRFLKKTLKRHGKAERIVTDGLRSYPSAMAILGNLGRREMGRWLNNRAENSHLPFRRRERAMLRFRKSSSLQKFASVHVSVHNHFNSERHLVDRQTFKNRRAIALAEWQNLAA